MENRLTFTPVVTGIFSILILLFAASFILSLILHFTTVQESSIQFLLLPITLITLFFGGFISGLKSGSKGWYFGGLTGLAFLLIIWLITFLGFDATLELKNMLIYAGYLVLSTVGGVFGVNMSPKRS